MGKGPLLAEKRRKGTQKDGQIVICHSCVKLWGSPSLTRRKKNCIFLLAASHFLSSLISAPILSSSTATGTESGHPYISEANPATLSTRYSSIGTLSTREALTSTGNVSGTDYSTPSEVSASTESPSTLTSISSAAAATTSSEDFLEATSTAIASSTVSGRPICAILFTLLIDWLIDWLIVFHNYHNMQTNYK